MRTPEEKAENLIKYFDTAIFPECPFRFNASAVIINLTGIQRSINELRNSQYPSHAFKAAYFRLYEMKKFLENG